MGSSGVDTGRAPILVALDTVTTVATVVAVLTLFQPWLTGDRGTAFALVDLDLVWLTRLTPVVVVLAVLVGLAANAGVRGWPVPVGARGAALVHLIAAATTVRGVIHLHEHVAATPLATVIALLAGAGAWWLRDLATRHEFAPEMRAWKPLPVAATAGAALAAITVLSVLLVTDFSALDAVALLP